MDVVVGALVAGISLVAGTLLGAGLEDRRLKAAEERRDRHESKERLVQSLDATRTMLDAQLIGSAGDCRGGGKGVAGSPETRIDAGAWLAQARRR
jgi:hypothetical protein